MMSSWMIWGINRKKKMYVSRSVDNALLYLDIDLFLALTPHAAAIPLNRSPTLS